MTALTTRHLLTSALMTLILGTTAGLAGCEKVKSLIAKDAGCSDPANLTAVEDKLQEGVLSAVKPYLKKTDINPDTLQKLVHQINTKIVDVRTQPSSQPTCAGTLVMTLGGDIVGKANAVRDAKGDNSIKQVAFTQDIKLEGNEIRQDIEYNLQPTDDGKKTIVSLIKTNKLQDFLAQLLVDASQNPNDFVTEEKAPVVAASAVVVASAVASSANSTPTDKTDILNPDTTDKADTTNTNHDSAAITATAKAQAEVNANRKAFNQMWNNASPEAQASLTDDQRQWTNKRDETCISEAEKAAVGYEEATRLQCINRMLVERYSEVKQYLENYQ